MTKQQQFFYDNAAYSWNHATETAEQGRIRTAERLALAETWAVENGYTFEETHDHDADDSWMSEDERNEDHEVISILMRDENGNAVQSLSGIFDPSSAFCRVVSAELALEEMR